MVPMSFMLFSLFFGAGNLIFPPFLGQNAGEKMPFAIAAFLITAVILPVLGVIVVAKFDGLDKLARKVDARFAVVFTIPIYLSIGPGLGIPRAASVPFEMAVAPYLPSGAPPPCIYAAVLPGLFPRPPDGWPDPQQADGKDRQIPRLPAFCSFCFSCLSSLFSAATPELPPPRRTTRRTPWSRASWKATRPWTPSQP